MTTPAQPALEAPDGAVDPEKVPEPGEAGQARDGIVEEPGDGWAWWASLSPDEKAAHCDAPAGPYSEHRPAPRPPLDVLRLPDGKPNYRDAAEMEAYLVDGYDPAGKQRETWEAWVARVHPERLPGGLVVELEQQIEKGRRRVADGPLEEVAA